MLKMRGKIIGVKTEVITGRDNQSFEKHFVGFEVDKPNGFEGETTVEKVQVSKEQHDKGLMAKYANIRGQEVEADVFINCFATRNGAGYQLFLSGDGLPKPVKNS